VTGFSDLARAAADARQTRPDVPLALATLVDVDGSSYRQPGARLLVDAEGRVLAGAVSGGCLEGDVAARAAAVCASGQAVRLHYDLRADLETIWGFGAACDGVAHLLLEPLTDWRWLAQAEAIRQRRAGGAVVTVLTPGGGRTAALLDGDAGGGEARDGGWRPVPGAEASADDAMRGAMHAAAALARRTGAAHAVPVPDSDVTIFADPLIAPVALHVVGASRGAEAFATIAGTMGWQVTVIDHRPSLLDALVLPEGARAIPVRHTEGVTALLDALPTDARTAVALLTHTYDVDAAWLQAVLTRPVGYIGVLGSRQRGAKLLADVERRLATDGVTMTPRMRQVVHAPIGLDVGGEDPAAIAMAAIGEISAVMHGRPGGFLRERQSPIHTRTDTPRLRDSAEPMAPDRCDLPLD